MRQISTTGDQYLIEKLIVVNKYVEYVETSSIRSRV